jgi:DNA-binding NarL/FixJ family response regulator
MEGRNSKSAIKILLADDHTMFRQSLARLLASYEDLEVVGETTNDEQAVALAREKRPDVVVMEVQVPLERAKDSLCRMLEISPPPKIVIATMFEDPHYMREMLDLGVSAYVVKTSSVEHLIGAICNAVFDPEGKNVVLGMPREAFENAEGRLEGVLTGREMEILVLATRGFSNRQIASRLHLAEATVRRHLANVYRKLGVGSRGEAMLKALCEGWVTIRDVSEG